jgi:two-component system, LytTR family, sensor kinase
MHTHPVHVTLFLHLAGFLGGFALYGMLLGLALRSSSVPRRTAAIADGVRATRFLGADESSRFHVFAGVAGVVWNAGALVVYGAPDVWESWRPVVPAVAAFSALGFLPAAAAHSVLRSVVRGRLAPILVWLAYTLSTTAAILNIHAGLSGAALPSAAAMWLLTGGLLVLALPMLLVASREMLWRNALLILALGVFAVTAVHLVDHQDFARPFWLQVLGHHASVPLAVAILVQDYPFAFSDLLLKRILSLAGLVGLGLVGVLAVVTSPVASVMRIDPDRPVVLGTLLLLIVAVALAHQVVRRWTSSFVDRVVLRRRGADATLAQVGRLTSESEHEEALIESVGRVLGGALGALDISWHVSTEDVHISHPLVALTSFNWTASGGLRSVALDPTSRQAGVLVPTTDAPRHVATIGPLPGGRPFLSADVLLLRDVALVLARRIDAIRIGHERFEQQARVQENARLAADAELRALRSQINPHFLFNALTTIGYLVSAAPDRAIRTLLRLTELLRRVLRTDDGPVTLATELQLVEAYLEIERARFEERLRVSIDAPDEVKEIRVPSFVLQPLVENAVKHGVAMSRAGGTVSVTARLQRRSGSSFLVVTVEDTGSGGAASLAAEGAGIGLGNVRRRLDLAYGHEATVTLEKSQAGGARSVVTIPVVSSDPAGSRRLPSHGGGHQ